MLFLDIFTQLLHILVFAHPLEMMQDTRRLTANILRSSFSLEGDKSDGFCCPRRSQNSPFERSQFNNFPEFYRSVRKGLELKVNSSSLEESWRLKAAEE